jgi:hypothetical protein
VGAPLVAVMWWWISRGQWLFRRAVPTLALELAFLSGRVQLVGHGPGTAQWWCWWWGHRVLGRSWRMAVRGRSRPDRRSPGIPAREGGPCPAVQPLVVPQEARRSGGYLAAWRELQAELAALSTRSTQIFAEHAGHHNSS